MVTSRATVRWCLAIAVVLICAGRPGWSCAADEPPFCGRTLDGWIDQLRHGSECEQVEAVRAIGYFGPRAGRAVPDLVGYLERTRGSGSEFGALGALAQIGPDAALAIPLLVDLFQNDWHSDGAEQALNAIGAPAVPALVALLDDGPAAVRARAVETLGAIGAPARGAVPALVAALRLDTPCLGDHDAVALRRAAVIALGQIGPDASAAIPALTRLSDMEQQEKLDLNFDGLPIAETLDAVGESRVAKLVEDFFRDGGASGIDELIRLGPRARGAAAALRKGLADSRPAIRIGAAVILTAVDPPCPEAVPVLIAALDPFGDESVNVPEALGRLGPDASAALPALIARVRNGQADRNSLLALVRIDPEGKACVPALIAALGSDDPVAVESAARVLGLLGSRASAAVPTLTAALGRTFLGAERAIHVEAARTLGRIGPDARPAIPALIKLLKVPRERGADQVACDDFPEAAVAAAQVLGSFGSDASAAVPDLIAALRAPDDAEGCDSSILPRTAAHALARIGPAGRAAIPALRKLVEAGGSPTEGRMSTREEELADAAIVALFWLDPATRDRAEEWAARSTAPVRKAYLLGGMGCTSLEGTLVAQAQWRWLDRWLRSAAVEQEDTEYLEADFERLGRLGIGGMRVVLRLEALRAHPDPFIRMWARETIERIRNRGA